MVFCAFNDGTQKAAATVCSYFDPSVYIRVWLSYLLISSRAAPLMLSAVSVFLLTLFFRVISTCMCLFSHGGVLCHLGDSNVSVRGGKKSFDLLFSDWTPLHFPFA